MESGDDSNSHLFATGFLKKKSIATRRYEIQSIKLTTPQQESLGNCMYHLYNTVLDSNWAMMGSGLQ